MPKLLAILHEDRSERRLPTLKVLHALEVFDLHLQDHLHLVIPTLLRLCELHDAPAHARMRCVWLVGRLGERLDHREWASQLVHGMIRVLRLANPEERPRVMASLVTVLRSLGPGFAVFAGPVQAELKRLRVSSAAFEELVAPLRPSRASSSNGGASQAGAAAWSHGGFSDGGIEGDGGSSLAGGGIGGGWGMSRGLTNGSLGAGGGGHTARGEPPGVPFAIIEDRLAHSTPSSTFSDHSSSSGSVRRPSHESGGASAGGGGGGGGGFGGSGGSGGGGHDFGAGGSGHAGGGGTASARGGSSRHGREPAMAGDSDRGLCEWDWGTEGDPDHVALGLVPVRRGRAGPSAQGMAAGGDAGAAAELPASYPAHHPGAVSTPKAGGGGLQRLKSTWEATQQNTRADWYEWMRRLSVEMLRESPSAPLRACSALAEAYPPLARELFNAAFLSCWSHLGDESGYYHSSLVAALETALDTENMSLEVLQTLLNLAEFMELADRPLPIDVRKLGALAEKCHAYAKALHYREIEFANFPNLTPSAAEGTVEALISINNHLQQPEAAKGILTYARQTYQVELKESWYEKLQRWSDACAAYERKQSEDPTNLTWRLGRMRCHRALGDWETLGELARETWDSPTLGLHNDATSRAEVARLAAAAAWNLRQWGPMATYSASMPDGTVETCLVRAVVSVHEGRFSAAQVCIDDARRLLDSEFTALVGESYHRAYRIMIEVLQLAELEEIIAHRQRPSDLPMPLLTRMWQERIEAAQRDADVWQAILSVRYLAVPPANDTRTWLKFCSLCRKAGRSSLSRKLLSQLLVDGRSSPAAGGDGGSAASSLAADADLNVRLNLSMGLGGSRSADDPFLRARPEVAFAYFKQLWADGSRYDALERMRVFAREAVSPMSEVDLVLAAKAWLKLGEWQRALLDNSLGDAAKMQVVVQSLQRATELNPTSYKAWHAWAMINFEAVSLYQDFKYVVPSIAGFVRSISLGRGQALQDTLRLLTMWFKYGASEAVDEAVSRGFQLIPVEMWLDVTPQIIARIHTGIQRVRSSVHTLLNLVAKAHPQGLIYPLTVASKSLSQPRSSAARAVLAQMRKQSDQLVEQAALVSVELIRTSILWHEMWHGALEEASRLYFGAQDVDGMLATLEPLHVMLQHGPETMRESSFVQAFGGEMEQAYEHCQRYRQLQDRAELHAAWDIYYNVFRRISKQIAKLTVLELQHVSPKLLEAKHLELAVPGTYQAGQPVTRIHSFARSMTVIASKQRPRKLTLSGSDGSKHAFLLKGHEDLR